MKVLIDQNDVIRAKGERLVRGALANRDRWGDGLELTETWVPDNTVFERVDGGFVIAGEQPDGWSQERTEVVNRETGVEQAIRLLENNPLPALPDVTIPALPDSPTNADVVRQVRVHQTALQRMANEVVTHRRYVEGYRKILLRMLRSGRG